MTPEQCQKKFIEQLEQLTGKKVLLVEATSLTTHVTLRMAKADDHAHVLRYRSDLSHLLPYLVASQCGLVLRVLHTASDLRFELTANSSTPKEIQELTQNRLQKKGKSHHEQLIKELSGIFQNALGVQLRSIPITLRVDAHIEQEYPSLREMQRACVIQHLNEGLATLAPKVRENIPDEVFSPSACMNAALAGYWSEVFGDQSLVVGYKATGFWKTGSTLLEHFKNILPHPDYDRQLVQSWIDTLGLQDWYYLTEKLQA